MKALTKYRYQQRIKELEAELVQLGQDELALREKLNLYKDVCSQISEALQNCLKASDNSTISKAWLVGQLRRLWK